MKQPTVDERAEYLGIVGDTPEVVRVPGTKRMKVRITTPHPGTINALTNLWLEHDLLAKKAKTGGDVMRDLAEDSAFAVKMACLFVLNSYWKIKLFYPIMWRWWAYVREFDDEQMEPIVLAGKKKLPLMARYRLLAFSADMITDRMQMTAKEAEQYRAELLLAAKQLSSKTSPSTGKPATSSSASSQSPDGGTNGN